MGRRSPRRRRWLLIPAAFVAGMLAPPAFAYHGGWHHLHVGYPPKPHGYTEIVDVFGQPCNGSATANFMWWRAADNGVYYGVYFHKKLGGSWSSNLDHDVRGHINNQGLRGYIKSGIYGYACRQKRGSSQWSTHAWGIAVDVSSVYEPNGQCYSTTNWAHDQIWEDHRWKWGKAWCDPMHFQYAADY